MNTSQVPSWSYSPDNFFTDFESNSTDNHGDSGDNGQKNIELSSQSSMAVNEPTSDSDISENNVPISTTSTTTMPTSTSTTAKVTTTPKPITTTITTLSSNITTTISSSTTTITTPSSTTTTITIPKQTSTTTTTPKSITTQRISTTTFPPIVIEITTPTTTTMRTKLQLSTTTTYKPNSITLRPKPAVVDISSTTLGPNESNIKSYLQLLINSTMEDVCDSEDELKDAIIKLFESGTERYNSFNVFYTK